jgi:putative sugar O-methyltransferase
MRKILSDLLKRVKSKTSISDNGSYPSFCLEASRDKNIFLNFRRNKIYNEILEHVTEQEGLVYVSEIKRQSDRLKNIELFKENDLYGNPIKKSYSGIGEISPTTLRYIKVLTDLEVMLGSLNNLKIVEIGVGYGGQCRIINSVFNPTSYTLIDLKPVLNLAKTYLGNYNIPSTIEYKVMENLKIQDYDLIISNYAFTELPKNIQDVYLKKVILKSKKGYITYNDINPPEFNSYKKEALLNIIPNSKISEEVPLTSEKNCIITW